MKAKVNAMKQLECWEEVQRPETETVLHTKFILKRK